MDQEQLFEPTVPIALPDVTYQHTVLSDGAGELIAVLLGERRRISHRELTTRFKLWGVSLDFSELLRAGYPVMRDYSKADGGTVYWVKEGRLSSISTEARSLRFLESLSQRKNDRRATSVRGRSERSGR